MADCVEVCVAVAVLVGERVTVLVTVTVPVGVVVAVAELVNVAVRLLFLERIKEQGLPNIQRQCLGAPAPAPATAGCCLWIIHWQNEH